MIIVGAIESVDNLELKQFSNSERLANDLENACSIIGCEGMRNCKDHPGIPLFQASLAERMRSVTTRVQQEVLENGFWW